MDTLKFTRETKPTSVVWSLNGREVAIFWADTSYQSRGMTAETAWINHLHGIHDSIVLLDGETIDVYLAGGPVTGPFAGEDKDNLGWFLAAVMIDGASFGKRELAEREYHGVSAIKDLATTVIIEELVGCFDGNETAAYAAYKKEKDDASITTA